MPTSFSHLEHQHPDSSRRCVAHTVMRSGLAGHSPHIVLQWPSMNVMARWMLQSLVGRIVIVRFSSKPVQGWTMEQSSARLAAQSVDWQAGRVVIVDHSTSLLVLAPSRANILLYHILQSLYCYWSTPTLPCLHHPSHRAFVYTCTHSPQGHPIACTCRLLAIMWQPIC